MSIPASRIKQLRAIFAKAKKQATVTHKMREDSDNPVDARVGRGNLSAWIEARPTMIRKLRDLKAGKKVQLPYYVQNRRQIIPAKEAFFAQNSRNSDLKYYDDYIHAKRDKIRRWIKEDSHWLTRERRRSKRRVHINTRKLMRGETDG